MSNLLFSNQYAPRVTIYFIIANSVIFDKNNENNSQHCYRYCRSIPSRNYNLIQGA